MSEPQKFLNLAVDAARAAGELALRMQSALGPARFKGEKDLVTEADLQCDRLIRSRIEAAFPDHDWVTEEEGEAHRTSEYRWYVDPIDGTINYAHSLPLWGVSVGLSRNGEPLCGAVFLPALNEMYTAQTGGGAFVNGNRLHVSSVTNLSQAVLAHGDFNVGADAAERQRLNAENLRDCSTAGWAAQRLKCLGSAAVEGAFVAAGRLDGYWMNSLWPWDVSVTALLVREAGGRVTDLRGETWTLEKRAALFSNGVLHPALLAALGRIASAA